MINSLKLEEALDAMYRDLDHYESNGDDAMVSEVERVIDYFKLVHRDRLYPNGRA